MAAVIKICMRKITLVLAYVLSCSLFAQDAKSDSNKRFQIGLQFNPTIENDLMYTGYFGANVRYKFYQNEKIDLDFGFNVNYLDSELEAFSDAFIFNPNLVVNFKIPNSKIKPYFSAGYAFYSAKFTPNYAFGYDPLIGKSATINYNGFSINPGARYHINTNFYIDLNYNFLRFKDDYDVKSTISFNLLGIGAGFKL